MISKRRPDPGGDSGLGGGTYGERTSVQSWEITKKSDCQKGRNLSEGDVATFTKRCRYRTKDTPKKAELERRKKGIGRKRGSSSLGGDLRGHRLRLQDHLGRLDEPIDLLLLREKGREPSNAGLKTNAVGHRKEALIATQNGTGMRGWVRPEAGSLKSAVAREAYRHRKKGEHLSTFGC